MIGTEIYSAFGNAVAAHRRAIGLTQAELAKRARMTRVSLANIESGQHGVLLHQVYMLAAVLGVATVADFLPPLRENLFEGAAEATPSKQTLAERDGTHVADLVNNVLGALFHSERPDRGS